MSENGEEGEDKPFCIEIAKLGRAACRKCKQKCPSGELRVAKLAYNPFGDGKMKQWYHLNCLLDAFLSQKATTKRIDAVEELSGFDILEDNVKANVLQQLNDCEKKLKEKWGNKIQEKVFKIREENTTVKQDVNKKQENVCAESNKPKDSLFREFRQLVADVTNESSYLEKTAIIRSVFMKGSDSSEFKVDVLQWCRLLLPGVVKRIYNLQSKQLVKLFSKILHTSQEEMLEDLEQGDIGETIQNFFEKSTKISPAKKSFLTLQQVDDFLEELSAMTKEEEQIHHFKKIIKLCTSNDLKIIIRLIKHDLRMNAGAKHVLNAIHHSAYEAFQNSQDLPSVIKRILGDNENVASKKKTVSATITVMIPVLPMLAEACKSVEYAMKKCPNGMYSEIKYDGERVQLHKHGNEFKFFSRSLKPVMPHKVSHFKDYIPQAFPHAKDLILDSEVLMIDSTNGKPLPFGSLGVHKKQEFKNANVCLFVFDCIYFNGEILAQKTMKERRQILKENMIEIKNHIMFSEVEEVHKAEDLTDMIAKVLKLGLEGLVLKDLRSTYEPGKRHWLKVKKDYLCDGAMADTADLIVLGAWFGTGKKGGMMSVFLMGCYDEYTKKFVTVTKVHTGHDDKTLEQLQKELDMIKISCDASKLPIWLKCTKTMVPDFVAKDPKAQPVWEITGAEFTQHDIHTADGISIRFPRVTRIRHDKNWEQATSLTELKTLFKNSKENINIDKLLLKKDKKITDYIESKEKNRNNSEGIGACTSTNKKTKRKIKNDYNDDLNNLEQCFEKKIKEEVPYEDILLKNEIDEKSDRKTSIKTEPRTKSPLTKIKPKRVTQKMAEKYLKELKNPSLSLDNINSEEDSELQVLHENENTIKIKPEKELYPTIFHDVRIFSTDNLDVEYNELIRHFIAVGGTILKGNDSDAASHIVHIESEVSDIHKNDFPLSARHVVIDWIKDSIGNGHMLETKAYAVALLPS